MRISSKGHKLQSFVAPSYEEAEGIARRIEEEHRGLFIDYNESVPVTAAQLIRRYIS